jgi:hypothetical protein
MEVLIQKLKILVNGLMDEL